VDKVEGFGWLCTTLATGRALDGRFCNGLLGFFRVRFARGLVPAGEAAMCCRFRCDAGPAPLYSNRSLSVDSGRGSKLRARCTSYPWVQRTDDFRACARACVWMCVWFVIMVEETSWYELRNSASRGPNEGMHEEKGLHLRCSSFNRFALFGCLCVPSAILLPATMILRLYNIRTIRFVERCGEGEGCQGQDSRSEEITCLAGQGRENLAHCQPASA
jgi:hypothetical protein